LSFDTNSTCCGANPRSDWHSAILTAWWQHSRRELLLLGVTARPSARWIACQLTEAYGWQQTPRYIVRDRDCVYGDVVIQRLRAMGIRDRPISPRSPWQNGYSERLIGSIQRDCLDHVVVFGERHLRHLLNSYQKYYNEARTPYGQKIETAEKNGGRRAFSWGSRADLGGLMQRDVRRPVASFEFFAGAARAWIVAARSRRFVELSQSFPRGATGKPVGMDVASRGGDPVNKGPMSCDGILVRIDQFLQPVPTALGAIELDDLEPVRPRVNERLPTLRIERDALDVAAAPVVPENSIRRDSRGEAESAHHPMRCLRSSACLQRL
jgi:Integrase core domain